MLNYDDKEKLLVEISKLYYQYDFSQQQIAERLNISRTYVSKLLQQAKNSGIVEIIIHDPELEETKLEREVRNKFGLKKAIIVPSAGNNAKESIAEVAAAAAHYVNKIIKNNTIIGYAWGYTIYMCSGTLKRRDDIEGIISVPLCGGVSNMNRKIYMNEIASNIYNAYPTSGVANLLPLPAILQDSATKKVILSDGYINEIMKLQQNVDIALFTVGAFDIDNALCQAGYLNKDEMNRLTEKGAVGDICAHIINNKGEICDKELAERTVSIDLEKLYKYEYSICVACGQEKVKALAAAVSKRYMNVLVTDESTIKSVLNILSSPDF